MNFFERILVPVDGSRPSEVGAALALKSAQQFGGELVFVNIVDVTTILGGIEYADIDWPGMLEEARSRGEQLADQAAADARAAGVSARVLVLEGPIVERLLDAIDESKATVVVVGSHGRGALARLLKGSTTDGLLRRSPVPVVVAPRGTPRTGT